MGQPSYSIQLDAHHPVTTHPTMHFCSLFLAKMLPPPIQRRESGSALVRARCVRYSRLRLAPPPPPHTTQLARERERGVCSFFLHPKRTHTPTCSSWPAVHDGSPRGCCRRRRRPWYQRGVGPSRRRHDGCVRELEQHRAGDGAGRRSHRVRLRGTGELSCMSTQAKRAPPHRTREPRGKRDCNYLAPTTHTHARRRRLMAHTTPGKKYARAKSPPAAPLPFRPPPQLLDP